MQLQANTCWVGQPTAAALVWLHDTGCCRMAHYPQVVELSQSYRVITLDLPGHGECTTVRAANVDCPPA